MITLLYAELRRLAASRMNGERADHTLTPTALVNEAYIRLAKEHHDWGSRAQFFAAAAEAMRRVLVDHANARKAGKRGGGAPRLALDGVDGVEIRLDGDGLDVSKLEQALCELKRVDESAHDMVMLRYFAGLTCEDAAEQLGLSDRHVRRVWNGARMWLRDRMMASGEVR